MKTTFGFRARTLFGAIGARIIPPIIDDKRNYQPEIARSWLAKQGWDKAPNERLFSRVFTDLWRQGDNTFTDSEVGAVEIEINDAIWAYLERRGYRIGSAWSRIRADGRICRTLVRSVHPPEKGTRWISLESGLARALKTHNLAGEFGAMTCDLCNADHGAEE